MLNAAINQLRAPSRKAVYARRTTGPLSSSSSPSHLLFTGFLTAGTEGAGAGDSSSDASRLHASVRSVLPDSQRRKYPSRTLQHSEEVRSIKSSKVVGSKINIWTCSQSHCERLDLARGKPRAIDFKCTLWHWSALSTHHTYFLASGLHARRSFSGISLGQGYHWLDVNAAA